MPRVFTERRGWLIVAAVGLPFLVLVYQLLKFAVNVPLLDEWEIVKLFGAVHHHTASFADFWAQHNEHRIVFPRLIMLGLALLTHWNINVEVWLSALMALGTCVVVLLLAGHSFGRRSLGFLIVAILTPWILFSPVQWENWLWGWQLGWFLMILMSLMALLVLTIKPIKHRYWVNVILAIGAGIIATYSVSNGLSIWLAGCTLLFILRQRLRYILAFALVGVVTVGAYFHGYIAPANAYPSTLILSHPFNFLHHLVTLLGRPLGYDIISSSALGILALVVFCGSLAYLWSDRRLLTQTAPFIALGVFALFGTAMIAFGRFGAGVEQAMSSRYYIISCLYIIATLALGMAALTKYRATHQGGELSSLVAAVFLGVLCLNNYFYGYEFMHRQYLALTDIKTCVHTVTSADAACLLQTYPDKAYVWQLIQTLKELKWNGF